MEKRSKLEVFYKSGAMAINTKIGNYIIGVGGVWDRNPVYTSEMAENITKRHFASESNVVPVCTGTLEYSNYKKFYYVFTKSTITNRTLANYKVFAEMELL